VLCIETFEHVFEVRRAFDEVFRVLKPGGVFVITSPLNFRIHAYPDDYWRMTPSCLRRMLEPYAARITGFQGYHAFPHTVMAMGVKAPAPTDAGRRLARLAAAYVAWARDAEAALPAREKIRRLAGRLYRSKGERRQVADYYAAEFHVDIEPARAAA
jgi:SAM-dependent methyltransferase